MRNRMVCLGGFSGTAVQAESKSIPDPVHYEQYRIESGRGAFIRRHWEKPHKEDLKKRLTPLQYEVTQNNATEPPFQNEFWNHIGFYIFVDFLHLPATSVAFHVRLAPFVH